MRDGKMNLNEAGDGFLVRCTNLVSHEPPDSSLSTHHSPERCSPLTPTLLAFGGHLHHSVCPMSLEILTLAVRVTSGELLSHSVPLIEEQIAFWSHSFLLYLAPQGAAVLSFCGGRIAF